MEIKKYQLGKMLELRKKFLSSKNDAVDGGTPFSVTVTGKKKKKPYKWVSPTGAGNMSLTASEAAKGLDAAYTPLLSWIAPNPFRLVDKIQQGDIGGSALEAVKLNPFWAASKITKAGDALASTTGGQALTRGLNWMGKAAKASPLAPLYPYVDAVLTSEMGAHGINDVVEGNATPMTALEIMPLFRPSALVKGYNKTKQTLRRWKRQYDRVNKNYDVSYSWRDTMSDLADKYDRMSSKAYSQSYRIKQRDSFFKSPINLNKASDENILKYLKKYYPEDEFYIENGRIYLRNGTIKDLPRLFLDYSTGLLKDFNFGVRGDGLIEFPRTEYPRGTIINSNLLVSYPSQEFIDLINNNTRILQEKIPGFIPFGSSQGVSKLKIPYTPHDIDGYITKRDLDMFLKNNPNANIVKRNGNETVTVDLFGKGEPGYVDLNIIDVDNAGRIGNERTEELFRQFFPEQYRKQIEKISTLKGREEGIRAINDNGIPLTFDDFVSLNYLTKTIMDSMEADFINEAKNKHIDRIFRYLISPNLDTVSRALSQSTKMLFLGTGRQLPKLKYGSIDENILLLTNIGYPEGYAKIIALDPQKMLNALDYWYLSNRSAMRASNAGTGNSIESQFGTPETLNRNFSKWNPDVSQGGTFSGGGINTTIEGPSGHIRHFIGYALPRVEGLYDGMQAEEAVKLIDNKLGLNTPVMQTSDPIAYSRELLNSGVRGMIGGSYKRGRYYGMGNLDLSSDGLGIFRGDVVPGWRDFKFPGLSERKTPSRTDMMLNLRLSSPHNYSTEEGMSKFIGDFGLKLHMKSFEIKNMLKYSSKLSKFNRLYNKNNRRVNRNIRFGKIAGVTGLFTSPLILGITNYHNDERIIKSIDNFESKGIITRDALGYIDMRKEDYDKLLPKLKELVDEYMKLINLNEFKQ